MFTKIITEIFNQKKEVNDKMTEKMNCLKIVSTTACVQKGQRATFARTGSLRDRSPRPFCHAQQQISEHTKN